MTDGRGVEYGQAEAVVDRLIEQSEAALDLARLTEVRA